MAYAFALPDLGEGLTEAEIARWHVAEGARVAEDDPLVEVHTDKTTVEIPSPVSGTVLRILVPEGATAAVGATLVEIGEPGEAAARVGDEAAGTARVAATPRVRALAAELGVDLGAVPGSGPGGRVTEDDVRAASTARDGDDAGEGRRVPLRGVRRRIAEHLELAHREIPAVTFVEECDFTGVDLARLLPLTLAACAGALREVPELNARLEGDELVLLDRVDIGFAVQTDEGLVVPVVRGCHELGVDAIAAEVERLAAGARAGTLEARELRGSTFSVTSAGKLGGLVVTPLINHPEVGILGVHRIGERPVARNGAVVVRRMGNVSVTFDHRVVDGVRAAAFCLDVISRLEAPAPPA